MDEDGAVLKRAVVAAARREVGEAKEVAISAAWPHFYPQVLKPSICGSTLYSYVTKLVLVGSLMMLDCQVGIH